MKKSLILVGLLSIGYAHAQYDGKVGVNTETPEEMLHINNGKLLSDGNNSGVIVRRNHPVGPFIQLENPSKTTENLVTKWRIFNTGEGYGNSLRIWAYGTNAGREVNLKSRVAISDAGNFGIGEFSSGKVPEEKLHIETGKVRINDLPTTLGATTDKVVVVDGTGVLKAVDRTSIGGGNVAPAETITATNGLTKTGSEVKLGGTLTEATTIIQNNHSIKFVNRTNDTEATAKVEVEGTTYLNGSVYKRYTVMTQSGELPNNAAFIENNSANDITITLPEGQVGREVCIFQSGTGSIDFTGPNGKTGMVRGQQITIASQAGLCLISNGKFWMQVTGY